MEILQKIFLWVLQTSLTASIAILIIILILKLLNKYIGVRLKHALWIIILIRLIIPVASENKISLFNVFAEKQQSTPQNKNTIPKRHSLTLDVVGLSQTNLNSIQKNRYFYYNNNVGNKQVMYIKDRWQSIDKNKLVMNIYKVASCVWLLGMFIIASIFSLVLLKFKKSFKALKTIDNLEAVELIEKCKKKAGINIDIAIYTCDNFKSPCILGIIKPKIYVPESMLDRENSEEFAYIILHELAHYKRKDLFYNLLSIVAVLIHWFNPMVWFAMNKMRLQRECACDAYVLELLGEEERIAYGMTLINFSRKSLNLAKYPQAAIFFETKNQIEGRIEMITKFKKGSYKMPVSSVLCCILAGGIVLTSGINVRAINSNSIPAIATNSKIDSIQKIQFLVDSEIKSYNSLTKAQRVAGFKCKVPDYMPSSYKLASCFMVNKISEKENVLALRFYEKYNIPDASTDGFSFKVSGTSYLEVLKEMKNDKLEKMGGKFEISDQPMKLGKIDGTSVTTKTFIPAQKKQGLPIDIQSISKYFIWQDGGNWYCLEYSRVYQNEERVKLSQDEREKIVSSIKYAEQVENLNYNVSTKSSAMCVYDKDDLKEAEGILGFKLKFPLSDVNKDIKISDAFTNEKYKEFGIVYCKNNAVVGNFVQTKDSKAYEKYDEARKTGYVTLKDAKGDLKKYKAQLLNISGKEVFQYEYELMGGEEQFGGKNNKEISYIWKENDICYSFGSNSWSKNNLGENEFNKLFNLLVASNTFN